MTAEIVIINQHGVAMAADSAVTIGNQKIINSAIKLFSLSRTEPVGIMIYGNANLLNIPWETLIKLYRKNQTNKLDKLKDYGEGFIDFLKSKTYYFSEDQQDDWAKQKIFELYAEIIEQLKNEITQIQQAGGVVNDQIIQNYAENLIIEYNLILVNNKKIYEKDISDELKTKIHILADDLIQQMFPFLKNNPILFSSLEPILKNLALIAVFYCTPVNSSGIVIAGFGNDDIFPSVATYEIHGVYNNHLLFKINDEKTIINENAQTMKSDIIPFAQEDVVRSFLDGIHPDLFNFATSYVQATINTFLATNPANTPLQPQEIEVISEDVARNFQDEMKKYMSSKLLSPMIDMIIALPKDELANMAEALVNMTAFRRKMAFGSLESVGGPVDVAVISKGDGLVWVKRKHYFPQEKNAHFFDNYFK